MKKFKRLLAFMLSLLMLLGTFVGCAGKAQPLMTLSEQTLSVNLYQLMLSIRKGEMAFAIAQAYGNANSENFWGTVIDSSSATYNDYYTAEVFEKAKGYLAVLVLFDELGLSLPVSYEKAIDEEMQALIDGDGDGSKQKLNALLAEFGANYDILKEYKTILKKTEILISSLYGKDGSKISTSLKESYLKENYVAFKQILLSDFYYLYKTDKNGDDIYYKNDGSIAYDTENGTAKPENGVFVYYTEDGRIAYDKENGKRAPILDENGEQKTAKYSNDQMIDRLNTAVTIRDIAENEEASVFESLRRAYSDEEFGNDYDSEALNYLGKTISYSAISASWNTLDQIAKKLSDMKDGEIAILQSDAGIHILRKYPTETAAYADSRYKQWFSDSVYGIYDFNTNLTNFLLNERLSAYTAQIETDTELVKQYTLKTSPANFYYH